jgi:predicted transcriptional regulator
MKGRFLTIRVTEEEMQALERIARRAGDTKSALVRRLVQMLLENEERITSPVEAIAEEAEEMYCELHGRAEKAGPGAQGNKANIDTSLKKHPPGC